MIESYHSDAKPSTLDTRRKEAIRATLAQVDGWRCHYCLCPLVPDSDRESQYVELVEAWHQGQLDVHGDAYATIDHKVPVSKGGTDAIANLVLCCPTCNGEKGARAPYEEFLALKRGGDPDIYLRKPFRLVLRLKDGTKLTIDKPGRFNRAERDAIEAEWRDRLGSEVAK